MTPVESRPLMSPPRFSLRSLFVAITLLCLFFAAASALRFHGALLLLLGLLVVLAHLAAAAIGAALCNSAPSAKQSPSTTPTPPQAPKQFLAQAAPSTRLSQRYHLRFANLLLILACSLGASLAGAALLTRVVWPKATVINISFGALAFAVIGAIGGFAAASFFHVVWQAWRQALAPTSHETTRRN